MPEDVSRRVLALLESGAASAAESLARQFAGEHPTSADAQLLLACVQMRRGDADGVRACLRRAMELGPANPELHMSCAALLMQIEAFSDAAQAYRTASRLRPGWLQALVNLGVALVRLGQPAQAEPVLREALRLRPDSEPVLTTLAGVLHELGRHQDAEAVARRAVACTDAGPEAWVNLGTVLLTRADLTGAATAYEQALGLAPRHPLATYNLAHLRAAQWRMTEAIDGFRRAVDLDPNYGPAWHSYLMHLLYSADTSERAIYEAHVRWGRGLHRGQPAATPSQRPTRAHDRRIRVGYVSADFRAHSCAAFLRPLLAHHDHDAFEIFAYANVLRPDPLTDWFRSCVDVWRDVRGRSDANVAATVRADDIDILLDLGGHSANHPIGVFLLRPAPVQVSWLGYPATSGLVEIGYRLTDAIADPDGSADDCHTEKLLRLPAGFLCYEPEAGAPALAPPPAVRNGFVTFGSFNNLAKLSAPVVATWAQLLRAMPTSRLLLKTRMLAQVDARANVMSAFAAAGVDPARIELRGWTQTIAESLAMYAEVDIALDTFPYNGTTTTLEALWMGVPVITMSAGRHSGRVGASILTLLGRPQWIAETDEAYVATASHLAGEITHLAAIRTSLREELAHSPLCDAAAFTKKMEETYRMLVARVVSP